MDRVLSGLFLLAASMGSMLGNFWFTYGIWPRSWVSFAIFACISMVLLHVMNAWVEHGRD